ncbi:unnamed protein product [Mytilus edulis]|uniref:DUF6589 domain-containing protein n=1 Tax=Mytilus edulis TaxID=6550 RepID=A0A8S3TG36_MYTED|nr:unnamed protein product [Mytilus edulis]
MGMVYNAKELTVFSEAELITVVSNSLISKHRLPSTSLPELNTQDPVNITSGVKRTFCSDHAYCTSTCNSFNEQVPDIETALDSDDDIDEEDDIDNGVKSVLDAVKGVNLTPSSRYDFQSILKSLTIDELPKINIFLEILKEMKERCPDLLYEMMNVSVKNPSVVKIRNITSVVLAYSALMFSRNNKNSAFQRCTTLMAVAGNASDEFIRRLNQMGISLSCTSKLRILEKAGETSKNLLVEKLKTNPRMKITGDNLDMYIKTNHQRQDNDNKDIHWFASNAFLSRLDYTGLSLEKPNVPLGDISPEFFIPNNAEKSKLRDVKKVLIGRMIVDKKDFDWLEKKLPTHIPHRYSEYMSKKQEVFSLPIIFKNESKNEDCLDIMDAYERQLTEIFTLAHGNTDMLQKHGAVLGGDQLTRERLQNVKKHKKAYKALYTAESLCTPGTLFHAKTILRRQDVTGNVKSNYKAHEDLFLLMVKALLHVAADQIQVQDSEDRDSILSQLYSKVHGEEHDAQDQVMNYFINVIEWGLLIINMNDTAKEGDFERLEVNCKAGIGFLLGHSVFSKYFGELVNYLLLTKHLLSPEMSLRALEGAFINTKGGPGKNKEADLVQEHCIRNKKDLIRSLGANKTEKAVMRACGAADTCVGVGRTVDGCLGLPKLSVNHTKKSSVKDLEILVKCLKTVDPFTYHKGRNLKSFCNIRKHPDRIINMEEMLNLIRKKVRKFFIDHS